LLAQHFLERADDGLVRGHPADKHERRDDGLPPEAAHHARHRVRQAGEHSGHRPALLLEMDQIRLGEDAAARGNPRRRARPTERPLAELLDGDVQPVGLLLQEAARARSAEGRARHPPGLVQPALQRDHESALAADLDDRAGVGRVPQDAGHGGVRRTDRAPARPPVVQGAAAAAHCGSGHVGERSLLPECRE